jgi:exodeoxyribonuclease V alpha subunit
VDGMGPARTLHSLLGARPDTRRMRHHAAHPLDVDVLMVDEASMVHLEMMDALLAALPAHARLVLLGDKDQLASVEAGAVLGDLCQYAARGAYDSETVAYAQAVAGQTIPPAYAATAVPPPLAQVTVMLRQSRRFDGPIGTLALAVNQGDALAARAAFAPDPTVLCALRPATPLAVCDLALQAEGGWTDYVARVLAQPQDAGAHPDWVKGVLQSFDRLRILCAVREGEWGVSGLNASVQKALATHAGLPVQAGEWYAGRPVMVLRNDVQTGVFNGDVGVALPPADGQGLRVWFLDGDTLRSVAVMRLPDVQTAFAMTVHKSQGSEFAHTVLVLPPGGAEVLSRELVYTGITRARERFTLVEAADGLLEAALSRPSVRASGLAQWWG